MNGVDNQDTVERFMFRYLFWNFTRALAVLLHDTLYRSETYNPWCVVLYYL